MLKNIFEKQDWHFVLLALLVVSVNMIMDRFPLFSLGAFWGLSTETWMWIGIIAAILHQLYVMIIWRVQLETQWLTANLPRVGYIAYLLDYTMMLIARIGAIVLAAAANRDSFTFPEPTRWIVALTLAVPFVGVIYSITRYYGYKRLAGADHFEPAYRDTGWLKRGIFQFAPNAIYVFGPLGFYIPGILLASPASLLLALFNHIYIWIHYYCTELPNLRRIYGPDRH